MTTYTGAQKVQSGLYFNVKHLTLTTLESEGTLPGTSDDRYRRVPMLLMLAAAPLLGLAYVIFLPLIGFGMVAYLLGHKAVQLVTGTAAEAVRVLQPGWAPALAFLSRNKPAKVDHAAKDAEPDAWKEEVERKLGDTDHQEK